MADYSHASLCEAAFDGFREDMERLLEDGADLQETQIFSALPYAALSGKLSTLKTLLDRGAVVDAKTPGGSTPLHFAVLGALGCRDGDDSIEVVQMLLDAGADVHARDRSGKTPVDHAPRTYEGEQVAAVLHAAMHRAEFAAFAMGQHARLGAASLVLGLEPELVRMILDQA
ncbi:ankyrin repeat-containing domain protein [Baffinella frigidus]|jgi:hypothetical protein|nr:ankyrin repeat-containing domain protein [Cryptophyta sp. CCMP2293]